MLLETVVFKKKKEKPEKGGILKRNGNREKLDEDGIPVKKSLPNGFGNRARQEKGMKQNELANSMNVRLQVIQQYVER